MFIDVGDSRFQFPRSFHSEEIALILDVGHGDSPFGTICIFVGLDAAVVELINGSSRVASQFTDIGLDVFVHFFGETEVVVAADASPLVFTEKYRPLVFPDGLEVL